MAEKKKKPAKPEDDDEIYLDFGATAASDDWLRYGRLAEKAAQGDLQAAKEMKEMDEDELVEVDWEEFVAELKELRRKREMQEDLPDAEHKFIPEAIMEEQDLEFRISSALMQYEGNESDEQLKQLADSYRVPIEVLKGRIKDL